MESQKRDSVSKWCKPGKGSSSTPVPISLVWVGCYISCAIFTVLGLLLGGTVGVLILLSMHLVLWLLVALLRFIRFICTL